MVTVTSSPALVPSTTTTVKIHVPGTVGVPLNSPSALSDKPFVRVPDGGGLIENVYGAVPPLAVKAYENGTVTVAVMGDGGGVMVGARPQPQAER